MSEIPSEISDLVRALNRAERLGLEWDDAVQDLFYSGCARMKLSGWEIFRMDYIDPDYGPVWAAQGVV